MHSFYEIGRLLKGHGRFIVTTVDTIFREPDFAGYVRAYESASAETEGMMAVTSFVDDEKPLYVETDKEMNITAFLDAPADGRSDRQFPLESLHKLPDFRHVLVYYHTYPFRSVLLKYPYKPADHRFSVERDKGLGESHTLLHKPRSFPGGYDSKIHSVISSLVRSIVLSAPFSVRTLRNGFAEAV